MALHTESELVDGKGEMPNRNTSKNDGKRGVDAGKSGEGDLTKKIESVTTMIPSSAFLGLALGAIGLSAIFQAAGRKEDAQFIGHWVPTVLILGLYNKLVKIEGSE